MFGVRHADSILHDLLPSFDLLHDANQLPRVLGHFIGEGADAVGHIQNGRSDLISFRLQDGVLRSVGGSQKGAICPFSAEGTFRARLVYLVSLVFAVLLTHAAHERPGLTRLFQADKLNGVDLVLRTQGLLVRLVRQRHAPVFGQRASGVGELRALGAQVGGAHGAVHGGRVGLVLIAPDDTLEENIHGMRGQFIFI